jgi:hypothetical protein
VQPRAAPAGVDTAELHTTLRLIAIRIELTMDQLDAG